MPVQTPRLLGSAGSAAAGATLVITTTDAAAVGDRIILGLAISGSLGTTWTATDSAGNTYAFDLNGTSTPKIMSAPVTTALPVGGTITVTFTGTSADRRAAIAIVAPGLAASPLDRTNQTQLNSATTYSVATSAVPTQDEELVIGLAQASSAIAHTPTNGFTELAELTFGTIREFALQWKAIANGTSGAPTTNGQWASSVAHFIAVATYKTAPPDQLTLTPAGVPTSAAVGRPALTRGTAHALAPAGAASAPAVGAATLSIVGSLALAPAGVPSQAAVGAPILGEVILLTPAGIASAAAAGAPTLAIGSAHVLTPAGAPSVAAVGSPSLTITLPPVVVIRDGFPGVLRWELTTLHYPDAEATVLAQLRQVEEGEVVIPLNDARTAEVTVSVYDPGLGRAIDNLRQVRADRLGYEGDGIDAYAVMLRAWYVDEPVFWGPVTLPAWSGAAGTLTLSAVDPSLRLQHHYLRRGDIAIGSADKGVLTLDFQGLRDLRDAALNTGAQWARGVPDIGIVDGANTAAASGLLFDTERGQQVWEKMRELSEHSLAPDFELEPVFDIPGAYCQLNTFARQGTDRTSDVVFHFAFGRDNLADLRWEPGGKILTHQHELSQDLRQRVTRAHRDSSAYRGVYVGWNGTEQNGDPDVLAALAEEKVAAYGVPPDFMTLVLPPDVSRSPIAGRYRFLKDFFLGDEITAIGKKGYMHTPPDLAQRITKVTLRQKGGEDGGIVTPEVEVVPTVVADADISDEDS